MQLDKIRVVQSGRNSDRLCEKVAFARFEGHTGLFSRGSAYALSRFAPFPGVGIDAWGRQLVHFLVR